MSWLRRNQSGEQSAVNPPDAASAPRAGKVSTEKESVVENPVVEKGGPVAESQSSGRVMPLFYSQPTLLTAKQHAHWRLLPGGAAFAAATTFIPLVGSDFAAAARNYPILFTSGEVMPVALVGLERTNLFVDGSRWSAGAYVPAYVRRYPFIMVEAVDKSGAALAVDATSELIAKDEGKEGTPLFEGEKPSAATLRALEFCRLFSQDHERTKAFSKAVADEGLLVERRADAALPSGRKLGVAGFQVVDPKRFTELPEEKVVTWHRNGWLGLIHFHFASLERFTELLMRQSQRDVATPAQGRTEARAAAVQ